MASTPQTDRPDDIADEVAEQPISVPDASDAGESGKLKMIVQLVKKCLGVKDIAAMYVLCPALRPSGSYVGYLVVAKASVVASVLA